MTRQSNSQPKPGFVPMLAPTAKISDGVEADVAMDKVPAADAESLLEQHYDAVYRYAYRLTGNSAAAEDVTQEVFVRAIKSWQQLREMDAALGWLLVITRNEFSRWCRKTLHQTPIAGVELAEGEGSGSVRCSEPLSRQGQFEQQDWVQRSMMALPAEYRLVVTMFYFEQLSYAEIAAELEIPIGTVMSRLSRAKKQLKDALIAFSEPCRRG